MHAQRGFTRVLAAEGASNFGSMLSRLAIPWLATLVLDATPWQMALLLVADVLAGALGSLVLGAWVDRRDKRAVMLGADIARAGVLALVALAAFTQQLSMALLLLASAAGALLTGAFELARSAWLAQRLAADQLTQSNARLSMVGSVSETAAFALGGWFFQWWGAVVALLVDACSYLASALCLRGIAPAPRVAGDAEERMPSSLWREMRAGLDALLAQPTLRGLMALQVVTALAGGIAGTTYMIFVARDLALPTGVQGLVFAMGGVGAVLGAAWASRLGARWGASRTMALGLALACAGAACVASAPNAGWLGITLLVAQQVIGDAGQVVHEVHERTLRQTAVAHALLARVDAGLRTVGQLATLAGAALGAAVATAASARMALVLYAFLLALAALMALRVASLRR
jgi:predicted MFS family arabinose efflux permease